MWLRGYPLHPESEDEKEQEMYVPDRGRVRFVWDAWSPWYHYTVLKPGRVWLETRITTGGYVYLWRLED